MSIIKNVTRDLIKNKESTSIYGGASLKSDGKIIVKDNWYNTEINKTFIKQSISEQSESKIINKEVIYKENNSMSNNDYEKLNSRHRRISNNKINIRNDNKALINGRDFNRNENKIVYNEPNIKNYNLYGEKIKKLNITRNDKFKVKDRYTNIIEDLKFTKNVNFLKVRKDFFKNRYITSAISNGIDNLNSFNNDYGNNIAREKMYRIASAPRDVVRLGRSVKRVRNSIRYAKDLSKNINSITNLKSVKLKKILGKGITNSLINEPNVLRGNENIGIQSIIKTKDAVVTTKNAITLTKNTVRYTAKASKNATKFTKDAFKTTIKGVKEAKKVVKYSYYFGRKITLTVAKIFSNPVMLKMIAIMGAIILVLSLISSIIMGVVSVVIGEESKTEIVVQTEDQREFILKLIPVAQENYQKYGIFPSVTIAQAIHESSWGKSELSIQANNLFGVKADSNWNGQTIDMLTKEHIRGTDITVMAKWRKYDSIEDSIRDHGKFLKENSRYEQAGVFKAKDYKEQAFAIRLAGYATDPIYASLICNMIESYALNIYDFSITEGNEKIERAILTGMSIVGKSPYVWGGGRNTDDISKLKFDCSSFVHWCYANAGINLGEYTNVVTFSLVNMGKEVYAKDMKRGDLIFFDTEGVANNHVGIYLGDNKFLHDAEPNGVWINSLEGYWKNAFNGRVRRIVE